MISRNKAVLCFLILLFLIFGLGCSKEVEEKDMTVEYINENLDASRYNAYEFKKSIVYQGVLLLEEDVTSKMINSEYVITTKEKRLSKGDSGNIYDENVYEQKSKTLLNPIKLSLKEEYFVSVQAKERSLIGEVDKIYSSELFGINDIRNINLRIILNESLNVETIEVSYIDNVTDYEVSMSVKYTY